MPMALQKRTELSESELRALVLQYRRQNWQGIQTPQWQERIAEDILRDDGENVLRTIAEFWTAPPGAWVLDVGSGLGSFVVACRKRGFRAFGVEPDRIGQGGRISSIQIARRRLESQVFAVGVGERLPFADRSFDLVTMNQVMEHVSEQRAVLQEALRVLKEGRPLRCNPELPSILRTTLQGQMVSTVAEIPRALVFETTGARPGVLLD